MGLAETQKQHQPMNEGEDAQRPIEPVVMLHFMALMEGLEIPNPEWYLQQNPEITRRVGAAITNQAKQVASPILSELLCGNPNEGKGMKEEIRFTGCDADGDEQEYSIRFEDDWISIIDCLTDKKLVSADWTGSLAPIFERALDIWPLKPDDA